jgi:hypothetical protein
MDGQRGQASSDYVAVLLVVVVVLGAAGTVATGAAGGIAQAVDRQMLRALCVVRGGDCEVDRRPCVTSSLRTLEQSSVTVAVVRLAHDRLLVRETRSDGTVAVTVLDRTSPGIDVALGARAGVTLDGRTVALGGEFRGLAGAVVGRGRTWFARDERAADALVAGLAREGRRLVRGRGPRRLRRPSPPPLPPPAQTAAERGLGAEVGLTAGVLGARMRSQDVAGTRVDAASGSRTLYVRRANEIVTTSMRLRGEELAHEQFAVTFDRSGRPVDLVVLRFGSLVAAPDLPQRVQAVAGALDVPSRHGRSWATEEHLDLTDGANLAAARAFLDQLVSPRPQLGHAVDVSARLRARLDAGAVVHASAYEVDASSLALTGSVAAGLKLGGSFEHTVVASRLLAASTRGLDGVWRARAECREAG